MAAPPPVAYSLVVAVDADGGIGKAGTIPWRLKGDMKFFRELTSCPVAADVHARYRLDTGHRDKRVFPWEALPVSLGAALPKADAGAHNAVIMGRKTWESLPDAYRPLKDRLNVVLSRTLPASADPSVRVAASLDAALADLGRDASVRQVYVIGGGEVYAQALARPECIRIYRTTLDRAYDCDVRFPASPGFQETASSPEVEEGGVRYRFRVLDRCP